MIETISNYSKATDFLKDWIEFKKSKRAGFSMRRLCSLLALKSPNYMALILDGKRALTIDIGLRLAKQMSLSKTESDYFISLIEAENSLSDRDQELHEKKVLRSRRHLKTEFVEESQIKFVAEWYHMLVRELALLPEFEFSPRYVVKKLNQRISLEEAESSLQLLKNQGLIAQRDDSSWFSTDKVLDTGDTVFDRELMEKHHAATLRMWSEGLATLNPKEQQLGLLHIPIATEKIPELRDRIRRFQDELIGWLVEEKNPDRVVQVGTYLIPFDK